MVKPILHAGVWVESQSFMVWDSSICFKSFKVGGKKVIEGSLYYESENEREGVVGGCAVKWNNGDVAMCYLRVFEKERDGEEAGSSEVSTRTKATRWLQYLTQS